jgi:putative flippase GtrA
MSLDSQQNVRSCPSPGIESARARKRTVIVEVKRFAIVGVVNTVLDLTVLNSLIFLTHVGRNGFWFSSFKLISFLLATSNSYFINHSWTFQGRAGSRSAMQASQFLIVSLFGGLINISAASYVATFVPAIRGMEEYWPSIAALVGTACSLASNFLGYKHIVFSECQSARSDRTV